MTIAPEILRPSSLRFHCPFCRSELVVPVEFAGVVAPCPSCHNSIEAPQPEALPPNPVFRRQVQPQAKPDEGGDASEILSPEYPPKFTPKHTIPKSVAPLDDSWKATYRQNQKRFERRRKFNETAQSFLESRFFRACRVVFGVGGTLLIFGTFYYMKTHKWQLPWQKTPAPSVAAPAPRPAPVEVREEIDVEAALSGDVEVSPTPPPAPQLPSDEIEAPGLLEEPTPPAPSLSDSDQVGEDSDSL